MKGDEDVNERERKAAHADEQKERIRRMVRDDLPTWTFIISVLSLMLALIALVISVAAPVKT